MCTHTHTQRERIESILNERREEEEKKSFIKKIEEKIHVGFCSDHGQKRDAKQWKGGWKAVYY